MISVEEALERIAAAFAALPAETVGLENAAGRVLAEDVVARVTQPPADVSAMDGYAIRFADVPAVPTTLRVIGAAPAGAAFPGTVGPGQAVRIFTGGPVPAGADTIVIQENTQAAGSEVTIVEPPEAARHIRRAGLDFGVGKAGLAAGRRLSPRDLALAAGMNCPWLRVHRRPRVALLATGNELVLPGEPLGPSQIVASSGFALAAMVRGWGGNAASLGVVRDDAALISRTLSGAGDFDLLVTMGGASVGDHDLVQQALMDAGGKLDFWKIAMRPGKPLMFGWLDGLPVLGLPGNPVSALVCAMLFLRPAVLRLAGHRDHALPTARAKLAAPLAANDVRQEYLRASLARDRAGELVAAPFPVQDSSMMSTLAKSGCLVVRPPLAPAAAAGEAVEIIALEQLAAGL